MSSITQLAGYALVLYLGWRLLRATILKPASPLDNIPGPPSDGWMRGGLYKEAR